MKIAVNTRLLLSNNLEGLGWFTYETLKRITQDHPEHEFVFIFDRKFSEEFIFSKNITPVVAYPPARHPLLWYLFFDWGIPGVLSKQKADIFLSPDGWLSLRTNVPSLPVIHDLNFFHNPGWITPVTRQYFNHYFPLFVSKANRIATVSEFSKNDISSRFKIPSDNIDVLYNGSNELYHPVDESVKSRTLQKYSRTLPYFLVLGAVHPRKNISNIILAYNKFRKSSKELVKLLIVGSVKYWSSDSRKVYEESPYRQDIIMTGRLSDDELNDVIASGMALVYTSLFEGFGIPILEAMRCGVPVITSNITSMPEVAGDAALFADPYSVDSISDAMLKIIMDKKLRNSLVEKGFKQMSLYSWDKTADLLWKSIEKIDLH
jgi:glycosyltransferase involved in cell wall biosynthesis